MLPSTEGSADDATRFSEYRIAAGSEVARENGDDGDLQGAGRRTGSIAEAESGRRPPGRPYGARGRRQSDLLLLASALRLLEKRAAWARTATGHVRRKPEA